MDDFSIMVLQKGLVGTVKDFVRSDSENMKSDKDNFCSLESQKNHEKDANTSERKDTESMKNYMF